jgi:hypothetical protein
MVEAVNSTRLNGLGSVLKNDSAADAHFNGSSVSALGLPHETMRTEPQNLHRIYRETFNRLDRYARLVSEGKSLEAALDFARYVFWSGIIDLCEMNAEEGFFKVDGAHLRWKSEELQRAVQQRFRVNDTSPHLSSAETETIHDKLDSIAGYLSKLSVAPAVAVNGNGYEQDIEKEEVQASRFVVAPPMQFDKRDDAPAAYLTAEAGDKKP